jgi:hypothetical protein
MAAKTLIACLATIVVGLAMGCSNPGEVSQSDAVRNQEAFSQDAYEKAMIKAGKGKELEEEKKRNAAHLQGGQ